MASSWASRLAALAFRHPIVVAIRSHDLHSLIATPAEIFSNPAGHDFHLKPGSPRPKNGLWDVGCYQRGK